MSVHFSGQVSVFHDRRLPEAAAPAGYAALIGAYNLPVPVPRILCAIGSKHRIIERDGWRIYTEAAVSGTLVVQIAERDSDRDEEVLEAATGFLLPMALLTPLMSVVAWLVLRWRNPRDAREPKDEREKLIDLKAQRIAYYALAAGSMMAVFVTLHVAGAGPVAVGMAVFMAFVLSQVIKHAARIVYYRRGS